ncbi:branched-chain amino acid ABC transporter permease [Pseudorhodoplanes sp.]|jgi:branched-chain amino acid transport system permease protein|uniref:branched-chain amino acid ABC transporter permease n=1 Tax=Pseudorhodoplanes sp. TaxID=1934341 RepID=UPI002CBDB23B|nr:branched-chain amino acid ABC transporter permease [Pseudorhodoplanes sp.]HWV40380.1 branched-chain amino acid ABC transporter permease [Pseudorhodoplanes sp.]
MSPSFLPLRIVIVCCVALAIAALAAFGDQTVLRFASRVAIMGLAAVAVDVVLGYAGLVSLGHAAFFGLGAYVTGALALLGYHEGLVVWPVAIGTATLAALIIGALALRTTGVYFIMITLAFAQMFYYGANAVPGLGGADGFRLPARSTLAGFSLDNPRTFFLLCAFVLIAVLLFARRASFASFGYSLQAARDDAVRSAASGIRNYWLRLAAFTISGAIAGLAGVLSANLTLYIAPSSVLSWHLSAELLVMVILGMAGTLYGAIVGAAIFLALVEIISHYTDFWAMYVGIAVIARVLLLRDGLLVTLRKLVTP